jgi:hypothetical protein
MANIGKGFAALVAAASVALLWTTVPSTAVTAELAKKCRDMAIKAYPRRTAGKPTGTAESERAFYNLCITNNGDMSGGGKQDGKAQTTGGEQK